MRESLNSQLDSSSPLRIKPRSNKDHTHPAPEPHAFGRDLTKQARQLEKGSNFRRRTRRRAERRKREREQETPHSAAQRERARNNADLVGVVVGVGVGAGGGIGSGAGADEDLEAAVLGPRHGAGGSRPTGGRLSQVS